MFTRVSILGAVCGALTATAAAADPMIFDIVPLRAYTQLAIACPVGETVMRCDNQGGIQPASADQMVWEFEGLKSAPRATKAAPKTARFSPLYDDHRVARMAAMSPAHSEMTVAWARMPRIDFTRSMAIETASVPSVEARAEAFVASMTRIHAEKSAMRQAAAAADESFMTQLAQARAGRGAAMDPSAIETASVPKTAAQRGTALKADAFVARMTAAHAARRQAREIAVVKAERFLAALARRETAMIATASIPARAEAKADAFVARMTAVHDARREAREIAEAKAEQFLVALADRQTAGIATASIPATGEFHGVRRATVSAKAEAFVAAVTKAHEARRHAAVVAEARADRFLARLAARGSLDSASIATASVPMVWEFEGVQVRAPFFGETP